MSRYFTKERKFDTLADAIVAGYEPVSTDLAKLDAHRIEAGERVLNERRFLEEMQRTLAPDGRPILEPLTTAQANPNARRKDAGAQFVLPRGGLQPLAIHDEFRGLFQGLYGHSGLREHLAGRALLKWAGIAKHGTLVLDTFHAGRLLYKMSTSGGGAPFTMRNGKLAFNYHNGLALAEYSNQDLGLAVQRGEITSKEATWARANRAQLEELMKAGLNIGSFADNLYEQAGLHIPGVEHFNKWLFSKLSRGGMIQSALAGFEQNLRKFSGDRAKAARATAKEYNEIFGNLQNQGIFKGNKTLQDMARVLLLAPQWTESQLRYELRAYGQAGQKAVDLASGADFKRGTILHMGNAVRTLAMGFIALAAANQVINYISRGQSTFQNDEDGHKFDAWIPGGKRGFWFSPMEIAGEYAFRIYEYMANHENAVDAVMHVASNKMSPVARGLAEAASGRDYSGRRFLGDADRFRAALVDMLPAPMPLNVILEKDPRQTLGWRWTRRPGAVEKQALQSLGAKVMAVPSARSEMYALAKPFRADRGGSDTAGEYTELRRALDNDDMPNAEWEIRWLLERGKDVKAIKEAVGISTRKNRDGEEGGP